MGGREGEDRFAESGHSRRNRFVHHDDRSSRVLDSIYVLEEVRSVRCV